MKLRNYADDKSKHIPEMEATMFVCMWVCEHETMNEFSGSTKGIVDLSFSCSNPEYSLIYWLCYFHMDFLLLA